MSLNYWSKDVTSIKATAKYMFFAILLVAISSMAGMGSPDAWSPLYDIRLTQAMDSMGLNNDVTPANEWSYNSIGAQESTAHNACQSEASVKPEKNSVLHIMAATSYGTCGAWITCIRTCQDTCRFTCRDTCISKSTCRATCQDTCLMTCRDTCQSTCRMTCQDTCGAKLTCLATCQNTCKATCMNTCVSKRTCRGTCQVTCAPGGGQCCPNNQVYELNQ